MNAVSMLRRILPLGLLLFASSTALAQTAPNFTVKDINGNVHTLYNYTAAGKYVLLDFFAHSCGPCYSASEDISGLYNYYGCNQDDLVVIVLGRGDTDSALTRDFANQANVQAPIVPGPAPFNGAGTFGAYGITGIPDLRLISPSNQLIPFGYKEDLPRVLDSLGVHAPAIACKSGDIHAQGFSDPYCTAAQAAVTVYNMGDAFIHTFTYEYALDGNPTQTGTWNGDLWTNSFFNNSAVINLPVPAMSDRQLEYTFNVISVNGSPDANANNDLLTGTKEIRYMPKEVNHIEDFEAASLPNLHNIYTEATWYSMPKWKQGPYSYGGGSSCIMLQGDSTMFTQAYNDEARFTLAYEWQVPPVLGDTPRVVFEVAAGAGNSQFVMEVGNHCDYINPIMGTLPVFIWQTNGSNQFFPAAQSDWRTVSVDIPTHFLTNSSKQLYIQWNFQVGVTGTYTPNVFIDNIRFENLAVKRLDPMARTGIQLWPNPGQGQLNILRDESPEPAQVELLNTLGQSMGVWEMPSESLGIDTQSLPAGVYLVRVREGETTTTRKWLKQVQH